MTPGRSTSAMNDLRDVPTSSGRPSVELAEPPQQLEVVLEGLAEADPGSTQIAPRHARPIEAARRAGEECRTSSTTSP